MPKKKTNSGSGNGTSSGPAVPPDAPRGERELVVMLRSEARVSVEGTTVASFEGADTSAVEDFLQSHDVTFAPLFGASEEGIRAEIAEMREGAEGPIPDLSVYYQVSAPDEELDDLAAELHELDLVEAAYVKPAPEPALAPQVEAIDEPDTSVFIARDLQVTAPTTPTPDFQSRQGYLDPAPAGVDAYYAWRLRGGRGSRVRFIDIEGGWRFTHEDLRQNQGGVVGGTSSANLGWENHGTAVVGVVGGDDQSWGIKGICPDAHTRGISIFGLGTAAAIKRAADLLGRGDILLIELHAPGPRFNFQGRADQRGYIPMEFWPDNWDAICYAVAKGVIVVEAGGNGAENLDDAIYDNRPAGFPTTWSNPFRRGVRDSGAILVGAGAPPPGTHGRNHGPDRSRLSFSNYGRALDVQGWGREVTTTGYAGLWRDPNNPANRDRWYTDTFSGTSSASPVVCGALGALQGVLRARGQTPVSPMRARELLRRTGSPQTDGPGRPRSQRIGNRPNLRQLIPAALQRDERIGVQFRGNVPPRAVRRWFTHSWPAQWHVQWTVVPTSPNRGAPQIESTIQVERATHAHITYWITVRNLTNEPVDIEARYEISGAT